YQGENWIPAQRSYRTSQRGHAANLARGRRSKNHKSHEVLSDQHHASPITKVCRAVSTTALVILRTLLLRQLLHLREESSQQPKVPARESEDSRNGLFSPTLLLIARL